ncbi:hypothetical protein ACHQIQ_26365 (plasmid) [Klebsiella pneumoniae]|uniref:hypothetical protein n=1 Tax=Klebsiella pneumoniae TaxID=573 RepID=UPI003981A3EB|nr:hypothetical protein [Klebsiella oxytoca]
MKVKIIYLPVFFIFFFSLMGLTYAAGDSGAATQTISGLSLDQSGSYTESPDEWVKIGELTSTKKYPYVTASACASSPLCARTGLYLRYGAVSVVQTSVTFYRNVVTLTGSEDGANYDFEFAVSFSTSPRIGNRSENWDNNRNWTSSTLLTNNWPLMPSQTPLTWTGYELKLGASGWCGRLVVTCYWTEQSYLYTSSGNPILWVKLPPNLKRQSYTFKNVKVMSIYHTQSTNKDSQSVNSQEAALFVSGSITLPQRCYSSVSVSQLDFGDVYANNKKELVKNLNFSINTDCYYAPVSTKHYITVSHNSGGSVTADATNFYISTDANGNPALSFVFDINKEPACSLNNGGAKFGQENLIRTMNSLAKNSYKDVVNVSLCKYGLPTSIGEKTASIEVISRWEKS